jgi:ribosomal protein S18 acetylase RimI-like enzyme
MTSKADTSITTREIELETIVDKIRVMRLCNENNYYENDVYCHLFGDFPEQMRKVLKDKKIYDEAVRDLRRSIYVEGRVYKGYFICNYEVPIGFILYQKDVDKTNELLFILIDKEHQNKGYGSKLLDCHDLDCEDDETVITKVENKELLNFYGKSNFRDIGVRKGRFMVLIKLIKAFKKY